jgi:hypothetical protein
MKQEWDVTLTNLDPNYDERSLFDIAVVSDGLLLKFFSPIFFYLMSLVQIPKSDVEVATFGKISRPFLAHSSTFRY